MTPVQTFGSKVLVLVTWVLISVIVSNVLAAFSVDTDGGGSSLRGGERKYESSMEACIVEPRSVGVSMSDIGGLKRVKEDLYFGLIMPLKYPAKFFGGPRTLAASRGWLLCGPPGTGKTLLARAIASESGATFISVQASHLESKYYGDTPRLLGALFTLAKKRAPSIIFFDEIDGICRARGDSDGCSYSLKTELLCWLDGFRSRESDAIVVIAASNNPGALDPALKRRLPSVLTIPLPSKEERSSILRIALRDEPKRHVPTSVIDGTDGYSGSDLHALYRNAASRRLRRHLRAAHGTRDVEEAISDFPPLGDDDWQRALREMHKSRSVVATEKVSAESAPSSTAAVVERLARRLTNS